MDIPVNPPLNSAAAAAAAPVEESVEDQGNTLFSHSLAPARLLPAPNTHRTEVFLVFYRAGGAGFSCDDCQCQDYQTQAAAGGEAV